MKIFIFGNIGSGKTSLSKEIVKAFPDWNYLAVDDYRRALSDGTIKGDSISKSAFVKSITHDNSLQIVECTGLGRLGSSVYRRCNKYNGKLVVIVLSVSLEECLERISKRVWDVPFPKDIMNGEQLVKKLHKQYQSTILFERWALRENTSFLHIENNNKNDARTLEEIIKRIIKKS